MKEILSRPSYDRFLEHLSKKVGSVHPDVCFYVYGSILRKEDFIPGLSDIDGGFIFPGGVVLDKEKTASLSEILFECLKKHPIDTEFNLVDVQSSNDGRFLSYCTSMTYFIKKESQVLSGPPELVSKLNGLDFRSEDLQRCSYNLRSLRNRVLYSHFDYYSNPKKFREGVISNVNKAVKLPKQLVIVRKGKLVPSKSRAREELGKLLPLANLDPIVELTNLTRSPSVLNRKLESFDYSLDLLNRSLEGVEQIISAYIAQFPETGHFECRAKEFK